MTGSETPTGASEGDGLFADGSGDGSASGSADGFAGESSDSFSGGSASGPSGASAGSPSAGAVGGPAEGPAAIGTELRRDDSRQALAGVCAGLGEYTRIDPVVWRAAFVLTAFAGGAGVLLYIAAWMLMRDPQGGPATFEQMLNRSIPPQAVLKLLTVGLAGATAFSLVGGFGWGTLVLAIPLALGLLTARGRGVDLRASLLALRSDLATHEPPPTGPVPQPVPAYYNPAQPWASSPKGPVDLAVVSERTSLGPDNDLDEDEEEDDEEEDDDHGKYGRHGDHRGDHDCRGRGGAPGGHKPRRAALASHALWTVVIMAVVWAVTAPRLGAPFSEVSTTNLLFGPVYGVFFFAAAVGVVGLYSLIGTWAGNPRGLMFLGTLAVLAAVLVSSTDVTKLRIGEDRWVPASAAEAESDDMWLNVGTARLDLTELAAELEPGQSVDVTARVDWGDVNLVLPEGVRVNLVSRVGAGSVEDPDTGENIRSGMFFTYESTFGPVGPLEPVEDAEGRGETEGRGDTANGEAGENSGETDGDEGTQEPAEGADDGSGQDEVPVINVHTSTKAGKVGVQYDQAGN
ncbi:PspC domain-containing protein [Nocardiopsis valliformis]|uniref:PspC domain-containing protein n=1 Tax=Nocardiopsis valliformis TaxID=239974 RepID=UPI00034602F7|nr:PspC domain-containing protein [Nocardiopsis valliformis]